MNSKIKELAEQAGLYDFVIESMGIDGNMQEFAESIIKECINTCERLQDDLDRQNWPTPYGCSEAIKEHFGVEE